MIRCWVISSGTRSGRSIACTRRWIQPPLTRSPHRGHSAAACVSQRLARSVIRRPRLCRRSRFVRVLGSRSPVAGLISGSDSGAVPSRAPRSRAFSCGSSPTCCRRSLFCSVSPSLRVCCSAAWPRKPRFSRSRALMRSFCRAIPAWRRATSCPSSAVRVLSFSRSMSTVAASNEPRGRLSFIVPRCYDAVPILSNPHSHAF